MCNTSCGSYYMLYTSSAGKQSELFWCSCRSRGNYARTYAVSGMQFKTRAYDITRAYSYPESVS